jgi:3-methyladenine DNA glycosylase AlkD
VDKNLQTVEEVTRELRALADPRHRQKMAYFGIEVKDALGIRVPQLRALAKRIGKNHALAQELWETGNHETRIIAAMIDEPALVTEAQMERWARDFNAWDIVDGCCCEVFAYSEAAWKKAVDWSSRDEEFVKRAGFSLMAYLAYKDKSSADSRFLPLLEIIRRESHDDRNFVRKAVNWALRNIGKRNRNLNRAATRTAREIRTMGSRSARWIAADALRELQGAAAQARLRTKQKLRKRTSIARRRKSRSRSRNR